MSKNFNTLLMVAAMMMAPVLTNAQWSAVRFDSANIFRNIYAATANDVFSVGTDPFNGEYFLLRSADGGTNWDSVVLNTGADDYQVYEMHFPDVNNGFLGGTKNGTNQVMLKSTDNGGTWTEITPDPLSTESITSVFFLDANQGWATAAQNLYITANGGANWTTVALTFNPYDVYFQDALVGYAAGGDVSTVPARMMKTTDGGQTWTQVLQSTDPNVFVNAYNFVNAVDATTIFTAQEWSNKLYRTTDAGATWDTIVCDSVYQIVDFHFESADSGHVLSSMGQLFYTHDAGASWHLAYTAEWGLYGPSVLFYSLNFSQGVGYVCGSSGLIKRFDVMSGIEEETAMTATMDIFPIPCYGNVSVSLKTSGISGKCTMRIMNAVGQIVMENNVNVVDGTPLQFDAGDLAAGNYTITLSNETQLRTAKLIKAE